MQELRSWLNKLVGITPRIVADSDVNAKGASNI